MNQAVEQFECNGNADHLVMEANRTGMSNDWYRVYSADDLKGAKFVWISLWYKHDIIANSYQIIDE